MSNEKDLRSIFEDLKCSVCSKYLSILPVFISTDGTQNRCGRCKDITTEKTFVSNKVYDAIAKHVKFPCSESESCKEMLPWEKAANHEKVCELRTISCPSDKCSHTYVVNSASNHFSKYHRVCKATNICMYDLICDKGEYEVVLLDVRDAYFFAFFATGPNYLRISVFSLNCLNTQYKYMIGFTSGSCNIDYNNFSHVSPYTGFPDFKIVLPDTFGYFKEDSLQEVLNVRKLSNITVNLAILKESESKLNHLNGSMTIPLLEIIEDTLQCPICEYLMTSYIYFCETGHSFCVLCRNELDVCPFCQCTIQSGRNLVLENLCENFKPLNPFYKINEE